MFIFLLIALIFNSTLTYSQEVEGTRELPGYYTPGNSVEVALSINVISPPTGLVINEYIPLGWTPFNVSPAYDSFTSEEGKIKWLFSDQEVISRTIYYSVQVPAEASGTYNFTGELKYKQGLDYITETINGDTFLLEQGANTPTSTPLINTPTPTPTNSSCVKGEVNCDGQVTPGDALLAFDIFLGEYIPTGQESCAVFCGADWDENGSVTPGDALCIFNFYLGQSC